jgi:hypothetical protein
MLEKCNKCISKVQLSLQEMNLKRPSAKFSISATIFQFREFPLIPQESQLGMLSYSVGRLPSYKGIMRSFLNPQS